MKEFTKIFGEDATKAVLDICKKRKITFDEFLFDFILNYADDEFDDYLCNLCDNHYPLGNELALFFD